MKTVQWVRVLSLVLLSLPVVAQSATNDLFNRANSNLLGVDWIEQDGDSKIANNQLLANSPFGFGWCSHSAFGAGYAATVIRMSWSMNGLGGDSVSMIAGVDPSSWSGIEVRIADNDGNGAADRIFFNAAVNAGAWYTSPSFANIAVPMPSGEATMWFSNGGDTVNVELKDPVTLATQVYSASGIIAAPPTGVRVGIGYFGNGTVDDFRAWTGSPTAPVFTVTTPRSNAPTTLLVTDAAPFALIAIGVSGTGAGPVLTPLGVVGLSDPIEIFLQASADAGGRLEIPVAPLAIPAGLTIHTQAVDVTALALTNYFTIVVL
jgi:hypothetical protein